MSLQVNSFGDNVFYVVGKLRIIVKVQGANDTINSQLQGGKLISGCVLLVKTKRSLQNKKRNAQNVLFSSITSEIFYFDFCSKRKMKLN